MLVLQEKKDYEKHKTCGILRHEFGGGGRKMECAGEVLEEEGTIIKT